MKLRINAYLSAGAVLSIASGASLAGASVTGASLTGDGAASYDARIELRQPDASRESAPVPAEAVPEQALATRADARLDLAYQPFGTKGQEHWLVTGGVGIGIEEENATDAMLNLGWSKFIADDVEISAEIALWGHFQDGDDAAGINPGFNLRWHFVNRDDWTLFADAGIGLLFTTDDVPDMGTSFNFTPRVGLGATKRIGDSGTRLIGGVRWHHISNARIEGEERNPDRDGVLIYAGVMFPF